MIKDVMIGLIFIIASFLLGVYVGETKKLVSEQPKNDMMTEWQVFTLAMIEVESEFDSIAINKQSGARGVLQIMPIYVSEANRLQNSIFYTHTDAYNVRSSINMFNIINADKDVEKSIKRHNPNSGDWYKKRVYKAMNKIRTIEKVIKTI